MEVKQYLIRGVASDKNVAKITVLGIPNKPGLPTASFLNWQKRTSTST